MNVSNKSENPFGQTSLVSTLITQSGFETGFLQPRASLHAQIY